MINIKFAQDKDIQWVNDQYKEINFVSSMLTKDIVAIAEVDREKAGLGRFVRIDEMCAELGGMFVFEKFRGQGIARYIIEFLLAKASDYQSIYCLPFEHLRNFYESFGFRECSSDIFIHEEIKHKHSWCNEVYSHKVLLLRLANFKSL